MSILSKTIFAGTAFFVSHCAFADLHMDNQTDHKIEAIYVPEAGTGFAGYRFIIDKNPVVNAEFTPHVAALYTPGATKDAIKKARTLLTKLPLFPEEEGDQTIVFLYSEQLCPAGALAAQLGFQGEVVTFCMATDKDIAKGKLWIAVLTHTG